MSRAKQPLVAHEVSGGDEAPVATDRPFDVARSYLSGGLLARAEARSDQVTGRPLTPSEPLQPGRAVASKARFTSVLFCRFFPDRRRGEPDVPPPEPPRRPEPPPEPPNR